MLNSSLSLKGSKVGGGGEAQVRASRRGQLGEPVQRVLAVETSSGPQSQCWDSALHSHSGCLPFAV